jgi:transposase
MCPAFDNLSNCENHVVIRFLHVKNLSTAEIHYELCAVCGPNVIREGTVRQWCRMFKAGRTNVHDEKRSGRPSVVSDDLVRSVDQTKKIVKDGASQFQKFHVNFHKFHAFFSTRLSQLDYVIASSYTLVTEYYHVVATASNSFNGMARPLQVKIGKFAKEGRVTARGR